MWIRNINFRNYSCYRGQHEIELTDIAYAVTARETDNSERSNWLGKSTWMGIPRFVLYGLHDHRTEDDWITRGEPGGEAGMVLDCGTGIRRQRARGKRTSLTVTTPDGRVLVDDAAQTHIVDLIGITAKDFTSSCWFQQRQMARFIDADPAPRMEMVSQWLQIGPLESAATLARAGVTKIAGEIDAVVGSRTQLTAQRNELQVQINALVDVDDDRYRTAVDDVELARQGLEQAIRHDAAARARADWDVVVAEGVALKGTVDADAAILPTLVKLPELDQARVAAAADVQQKRTLLTQARATARGEFDGQCPVTRKSCPIVNEINADVSAAAELVKVHETSLLAADAVNRAADAAYAVQKRLQTEIQERQSRLNLLRERATKLKEEIDKSPATALVPDVARERLSTANELVQVIRDGRVRKDSISKVIVEIDAKLTALGIREDALRVELDVARKVAIIFGRNGAQRLVAKTALDAIAGAANGMLEEATIPLRVSFSWGIVTDKAAKHCEECGTPFPTSTKVRNCERCKAERGFVVLDRLDLNLSDVSGGANDLAGIAVQLAASRWLRLKRGTPWSVAGLDEPFGQLDLANRRALANHLAALLRGRYGFSQAFVVAHQPGTLEAFPGRIEITKTPDGSRKVEVIS